MKYTKVDQNYTDIFSEIYSVLCRHMTPNETLKWLNTPNTDLYDQVPVVVINRGEGLAVRAAAYATEEDPHEEAH